MVAQKREIAEMFRLEYAQNYNGRFAGWCEGGEFPDRPAAEAEAKRRGLTIEGDDHIISEVVSA